MTSLISSDLSHFQIFFHERHPDDRVIFKHFFLKGRHDNMSEKKYGRNITKSKYALGRIWPKWRFFLRGRGFCSGLDKGEWRCVKEYCSHLLILDYYFFVCIYLFIVLAFVVLCFISHQLIIRDGQ